MATITNHNNLTYTHNYSVEKSASLSQRFNLWLKEIEMYRYPILSAIVVIQGCIIIPFTLMLAVFFNIGLEEITVAAVAITTMAVMVTNMAILSMKTITITFALNVLINLILVAIHLIALI